MSQDQINVIQSLSFMFGIAYDISADSKFVANGFNGGI